MAGAPDIRFEPVRESDLPLLRRWLDTPHMREWWGGPDAELSIIRHMVEGRDTTRPFIFHVDDEPLGYIQCWTAGDEQTAKSDEPDHWVMSLSPDTIGIDLSIGDPARLSQGHGSAVLRAFVDKLIDEGAASFVIDPDAENARAIRAYEKAGFVAFDRVDDDGETKLLMKRGKDTR